VAWIVARGAATNAPRREADAATLEPFHRGGEVVDPQADVIERRLVDPGALLGIDGLHQVHLDSQRAPARHRDVLVHVLGLAAEAALLVEAEQIEPQPSQRRLVAGTHRNLLQPQHAERSIGHCIPPAASGP
jgi:hypothetical protein